MEEAPNGTVIGTVFALDPDMDNALTFALTDDADGRFAIDPDSGVITVADATLLDHDAAAQHSIEVRVTDAHGLSDTATYVVELLKDNSGNDTLLGEQDAETRALLQSPQGRELLRQCGIAAPETAA